MVKGLARRGAACAMVQKRPSMLTQASWVKERLLPSDGGDLIMQIWHRNFSRNDQIVGVLERPFNIGPVAAKQT